MAYDAEQLNTDVEHLTQQPGWKDPAKRDEYIRNAAVKLWGRTDPETHSKLIGALWEKKDADRGWLQKAADFTARGSEEVLKSIPASGMAAVQGASDVTGLTDTGSQVRLTGGVKGLVDATGQRLKQLGAGEIFGMNLLPGVSRQKQRDDTLEALKKDLDNGAHPKGLEDWLAGKYDDGKVKPDEETQRWIDALTRGIAQRAVAADHMGEVKPERVDEWLLSDRNPARVESWLTPKAIAYGLKPEPGPREHLADYLVTRDPASWAAFQNRVTETDAQYRNRMARMEAEAEAQDALRQEPNGLMKDLTQRGLDMQTSPIDLAASALPLLRGSKALVAAKAGGTAAAVGMRVAKDAAKEALQEGVTEYLQDPRASGTQVAEAAGLGAVGSTVVEGTMAGTGAAAGKLFRPVTTTNEANNNNDGTVPDTQTTATPGAGTATNGTPAPMGGGAAAGAGPEVIGGRPVLITPKTEEEAAQVRMAREGAASTSEALRKLDALPEELGPPSMAEIAITGGRLPVAQPSTEKQPAAPEQPGGVHADIHTSGDTAPDSNELQGMRTEEVPLNTLSLSTDVPQFKSDANEQGVVEPLAGKYERLGTGPVLIWERKNGKREVISGRHRFDLAKRTGEKTIPGQIVREADGFTLQHALTADAELNIRDGHGKTKDFANYFRHAGLTDTEAESRGLRARAAGRAGWAIGTQASQAVFDLHQNGKLTDAQAEALASTAPHNEALQRAGIVAMNRGTPIDVTVNLLKAMQLEVGAAPSMGQMDLFGADDSAMQRMEEQARKATEIQRGLREQVAVVQGAAKRPDKAKALGVNVKDPQGVLQRVNELKGELYRWESWPLHEDLRAQVRGVENNNSPAFGLESSTAEQLAAEQAAAERKAKMNERQQAPLKGDAGEYGTPDMLDQTAGDMALFNRLQFSQGGALSFVSMAVAKARLAMNNFMGRVDLGEITPRAAMMVERLTGRPAAGSRVNLRLESWRHMDKQHGAGSSVAQERSKHRDQIPLEASDIDLLGPVTLNPDAMGVVLDAAAQRKLIDDPNFIPEKMDFSLVSVKDVGNHMVVVSALPNLNKVMNVRTAYKRKMRQGMRAEDVLQGVLQENASKANRALTQGDIIKLLNKRQAIDAAQGLRQVQLKSVRDALQLIMKKLPGLQNGRVLVFKNAAEFLASGYARPQSFNADEQSGIQGAEAFFDPLTGHTIVLTNQIELREGETSIRAVARVLLHERVGHEGVNTLLQSDPVFAAKFAKLAEQIPAEDLRAISEQQGYEHLAGDSIQLALEWLARQADQIESARNAVAIEGGLQGLAKQMWQAVKEWLARFFADFSRKSALAREVHEIVTLAREAALNGTADPTSAQGLVGRVQFSYESVPDSLMGFSKSGPNKGFHEAKYPHVQNVKITWGDGAIQYDAIKGLNKAHALERAKRNWPGAPAIEAIDVLPDGVQFSMGGTRIRHAAGTPYRVNDRAWRAILTGSALPRAFTEAVEMTERERKALDQRTAQVGNDLKTAVESYAERSGQPLADVYSLVNDALSGAPGTNAVLMQVDTVLHQRALEARALLDALSTAVAQTLPAGDLRNTIMLNQGAWMKRSYAAFDPASGWNYDNVMQAARDGRMLGGRDARAIVVAARVFLRGQHPNASASEIDADMRDLMDRDVIARALTGSASVRNNISSLLQRRDIPVELRELMGEEKNPIKRFLQSTSFQAQFIHRYQQQRALRTIGLQGGLFQTTRGGPDGVFKQQIPSDDRSWSGLAGLWTTPQLWEAMQHVKGANTGTELWSHAGEALKALGNEAKLNRVAMNPDSWVVNAAGNVVALVQTGDVFYSSIFRRVRQAAALMRSGRGKPGDVAHNAAQALQDTQRAMVARLTASGVLGQNFNLRDLEASIPRHLLAWVNEDQARDRVLGGIKGAIAGQAAGRGFGLPGRVVGGAIGAAVGGAAGLNQIQTWQQAVANYVMTGPDALARLTGFLGNLETAHAAGMVGDAAYAHAVDRTRNTFPDYGRMPELLKTLSRYGVAGSFIGFQYEVYRNTMHNLRYAWEDIRSGNAALVERGIKRTIGAAVIGSLVAGGMQAIFQGLAGTDDERNKKWRKWFGAPWEKNGVLVFTNYGDKSVSYFNTSYLIPQATLMELVNAAAAGNDPKEAAGNVTAHVWEQFMGSSVHLGPILSAVTNTDRMGRPLTYEKGAQGMVERIDAAAQTILEPGWAAKLERLEYAMREAERKGRLFSVEEEIKRLVGVREFTRSWPDMVKAKFNDFATRNAEIRAAANRELGKNLPGAKQEAITRANEALAKLADELREYEADLMTLGVPDSTARTARKDSSVPRVIYMVELDKDGKHVKSIGTR